MSNNLTPSISLNDIKLVKKKNNNIKEKNLLKKKL